MKSILRATAVLSSASAVSILMGLVSAKVSAVLLGPGGVGFMGLLQSLLGLAALISGMGIGIALVRAGAKAISLKDERQLAALRSGAWLLCWLLGGLTALAMILLRTVLSREMLGGTQHGGVVILAAGTLLLTMAAGVQSSILNAHHRVGDLARVNILSSVLGVGCSLIIIWRWRAGGIAWAVLAVGVVNFAVSYYYMRRRTPAMRVRLAANEVWAAARSLLRFGAPYTASMLVGTGVQLALPVLVLHILSTDDVGFYRAASAISISYLSFLTAAMAQDYYPRLSAVTEQPGVLGRLVNEQHRLVMLIGGPIILGMIALVPYLVPLVYSPQFTPAVALLEWQLVGDVFKFAAWAMSFVILARSGSLTYFCTEMVGGGSLLLFSWMGMRWFGLEGLGLGFLLCTVIYYVLCWTLLRRSIGLRWSKDNKIIFLTLVLAASTVRAWSYVGPERARTPLAIAMAMAAGFCSLYLIWSEVGGIRGLLARHKVA